MFAISNYSSQINYVEEEFLSLFQHRFDYIYAKYSDPGYKPNWKTECRYPLSDRLILKGDYLYGVRFGKTTSYLVIDIDNRSPYHPNSDCFAVSNITAALEEIGLTRYVACTSSYSGGIHLYFPFNQPYCSWQIASVVTTLLERSGFAIAPGKLEIFPNRKPYIPGSKPTLFNAHRLPLQVGSYLLNENFEPIWSDRQRFVQQWHLVQDSNTLNTKRIQKILKENQIRRFRISGNAKKFIEDLNAEIDLGWTGYGQTNRLLGRIAMRTYIFHHVLFGGQPLSGQELTQEIVKIATSLSGYSQWCQHQHEIETRAEEWARCIENSHYYHYGLSNGLSNGSADPTNIHDETKEITSHNNEESRRYLNWNQKQLRAVRERIEAAVTDLLQKDIFPSGITERFKTLLKYGIGGASLYRHKDLWHPSLFNENSSPENLPNKPLESLQQGSKQLQKLARVMTSLLSDMGSNSFVDEGFGDRPSPSTGNLPRSLSVLASEQEVARVVQGRSRGAVCLLTDGLTDGLTHPLTHPLTDGLAQDGTHTSLPRPVVSSWVWMWLRLSFWSEFLTGVVSDCFESVSSSGHCSDDRGASQGWVFAAR